MLREVLPATLPHVWGKRIERGVPRSELCSALGSLRGLVPCHMAFVAVLSVA